MTKISDAQRQILTSIGHAPRTSRYFTTGLTHIAPTVVMSYISHLVDAGLIDAPDRTDGSYTITDAGRDCLALTAPVQSRKYGNFAMPSGSLVLPKWGRENVPVPSRGRPT